MIEVTLKLQLLKFSFSITSCRFHYDGSILGILNHVFSETLISIIGRAQTTINELQKNLRYNPAVSPERRLHRRSRSESPTHSYRHAHSRSSSPRASPSPRSYRCTVKNLLSKLCERNSIDFIKCIHFCFLCQATDNDKHCAKKYRISPLQCYE